MNLQSNAQSLQYTNALGIYEFLSQMLTFILLCPSQVLPFR